jgi:hypothetical protein
MITSLKIREKVVLKRHIGINIGINIELNELIDGSWVCKMRIKTKKRSYYNLVGYLVFESLDCIKVCKT